ncbi:MAG TPA: hypothetical protein VL688_05245 [Verrucomicrobiae bacterium]|jgi:hypothetical protein|nr:hypothetical protein [Verrucomicrobiae bacterium]
MKKFSIWGHFVLFIASLVFLPAMAQAAIVVDANFQGTLVITTPEGEINLVEPGDAIPEIKSGSILEVFDGQFKVTTAEGDNVELSCLENDASASGASALVLACGDNAGSLKVETGNATIVDPSGQQIQVPAGTTHEIKLTVTEEADATAAGDEIGTSIDNPGADVDSTNIDATDANANVTDNQENPSTASL